MSIMKKMAIAASVLVGASSALAGGIPAIDAELFVTGLVRPIGLFHAPGDPTRLFVIQKSGQIRVIENGTLLATPFLDIDPLVGTSTSISDERGLLGLAFHPDYQNNGTFFVNYNNNSGTTVIAKYQRMSDNIADASSGDIILTYSQPFSNHNGGWIEFGPNDGYLYIAAGDGGSGNDPGNRAQDTTNQMLGKMLRIDVDGDDFPADANRDYAIPATNPFVGTTGDDEIWAWGLRNPWRNAFDRETGDLFIADVGQGAKEEINFLPASFNGGNFGWRCREGFNCTGLSGCVCSDPALVEPIWDYPRTLGISVTGGRIYRGCAIPGLQGVYFFADYGSSRIWAGRVDASGTQFEGGAPVQIDPDLEDNGQSVFNIASFGEDAEGEIYIVSQSGGRIFRIVPEGGIVDDNMNGIADTCEAMICLGDCDNSGTVDFNDLVQTLFVFGQDTGDACDADESGNVDFNDLVATLFLFGPCK